MPPKTSSAPDLRASLAPYTEWASSRVHERFPGISPDHFSFAGAALVSLGAIMANRDRPGESLALNLVGAATDSFNGAYARVCYAEEPARLERGNQVDSLSDLIKDMSMSGSKIGFTNSSNARLSRVIAEIAAITTPVASLSRSYQEERGFRINEHGNNYMEFIGTRAARTALHAVSASNIKVKGIPLQPYIDTLITAGNLTRIAKNLRASEKEQKTPYMRRKASFRTRFHSYSTALTAAGVFTARKLLK